MISISKKFFSSGKYIISKDGTDIGTIKRNSFYNTFTCEFDDHEWKVKHKSFFSSSYNMLKGEEVLFLAKRKYNFLGAWEVTYKSKTFIWEKTGYFTRNFVLKVEGLDKPLGYLKTDGFITYSWDLDFPSTVDKWFQIGLFCLSEAASLQNKNG